MASSKGRPPASVDAIDGGTHQRSRHAGNFVVIPNGVAQFGKPLSLRALGLLTYILSLPTHKANGDPYVIRTPEIVAHWPEGRDAILTAMAELRGAGLARQFRTQDHLGHWRTRTVYYDVPQTVTEGAQPQAGPEPDFQASA